MPSTAMKFHKIMFYFLWKFFFLVNKNKATDPSPRPTQHAQDLIRGLIKAWRDKKMSMLVCSLVHDFYFSNYWELLSQLTNSYLSEGWNHQPTCFSITVQASSITPMLPNLYGYQKKMHVVTCDGLSLCLTRMSWRWTIGYCHGMSQVIALQLNILGLRSIQTKYNIISRVHTIPKKMGFDRAFPTMFTIWDSIGEL